MKRLIIILLSLISMSLNAQTITAQLLSKQRTVESGDSHYDITVCGDTVVKVSRSGAIGVAQFMPSTWEWMKQYKLIPEWYDITNVAHQKTAQYRYMKYLYHVDYGIIDDKMDLALAAYNAGVNRVIRLINEHGINWRQYLPSETKQYLNQIKG